MNKLKPYLLPAFGFTVSVVALMIATPPASQAVPSDKDVHVINAPFDPVPTAAQGTTNIAGNVSVTNTPTVNLGSGASVSVSNTAAHPVPVSFTTEALEPFQTGTSTTESGTNVSTLTVTTVPVGKRLVIEFVSMTGQVPPGQHVEIMELTTSNSGGGVSHQFVIQPQPDAVIGDALFRTNQSLKLYANGGTTVQALFRRSSTVGTANYGLSISGYLVDM